MLIVIVTVILVESLYDGNSKNVEHYTSINNKRESDDIHEMNHRSRSEFHNYMQDKTDINIRERRDRLEKMKK